LSTIARTRSGGSQGDDFRSRITIDGAEITYRDQVWTNGSGGGTRSSVVFPISMVYANSSVSTLTVKVSVARNGADDNLSRKHEFCLSQDIRFAR
jgi:hypothetical protein